MDEAHTQYHKDAAAANKCKVEYWTWFDAVKHANPQIIFKKYGCCQFLDPHLNDHGLDMAKFWFREGSSVSPWTPLEEIC